MTVKRMGKGLAVYFAVAILSAASAMTAWAKERLGTVNELYWNEDEDGSKATEAIWEEVEDAYEYKVRLYRDDSSSSKAEITTKKTSYNFKRYMTTEGEYTFKVQAVAKKNSKDYLDSYWSDESEARYVSEARADSYANKKQDDTSKGGPGAGSSSDEDTPKSGVVRPEGSTDEGSHLPIAGSGSVDEESKPANEGSRLPIPDSSSSDGENKSSDESSQNEAEKPAEREPGQWIKDDEGWWYRWPDGTYPAGQWFEDPADGNWYKLDGRGYMMTGWIVDGEKRYYCDPDGNPMGAMVTGEKIIKGVPYTFDSSGAMKDDYIPSVGSSSDDD